MIARQSTIDTRHKPHRVLAERPTHVKGPTKSLLPMAQPDWEDDTDSMWLLLPEPVRNLPADLAAVITLVILTGIVVLVPPINDTPLRVLLGLPFILFLPGYALIAALFPEEGSPPTVEEDTADEETADTEVQEDEAAAFMGMGYGATDRGIDGIERVALSFGLSIAVVPLLGLVLNFTPWGIRLVPIVLTIAGFTLAMTAVAAIRRRALPPEDRFAVPYRDWIDAGREELFNPESRLDGALNVLLAVSILLAIAAVSYAILFPPQGETFTEFYILTEDDDGELVAAGYPTEFDLGDSEPVIVGVENHEAETLEYTVVIQLQEVEQANNETEVIERQELDRFTTPAIADNETYHHDQELTPTMAGEDLRLQFLLYRGEAPDEPTRENAYRDLHLWIDVDD